MGQAIRWTYPEVSKALEDKRSASAVAHEMKRSVGAVRTVRSLAGRYKSGELRWVTKSLRTMFDAYYADKEATTPPVSQVVESTMPQPVPQEQNVDMLMQKVDDTMIVLKEQISDLVAVMVDEQVRAVKKEAQEAKELRKWKEEAEKELQLLREFKEQAKGGNFLAMMKKKMSRPEAPTTM